MPDHNHIHCLVFLEFVDEAEAFIRQIGPGLPPSAKVMAVSFHPKVDRYLAARDIPFTGSALFAPRDSHVRMLDASESIQKDLRRMYAFEDDRGCARAYGNTLDYYLRNVFSSWMYRAEVISNALDYYRPLKVCAAEQDPSLVVLSNRVDNLERFLGGILSQLSDQREISYLPIHLDLADAIRRKNAATQRSQKIRAVVSQVARPLIPPPERPVLALGDSHNLSKVLVELAGAFRLEAVFLGAPAWGKRFRFFSDAFRRRPKKGYRYLYQDFSAPVPLTETFARQKAMFRQKLIRYFQSWTYRGVSCAQWFQHKYERSLEALTLDRTFSQSVHLDRALETLRPRVVVAQHAREGYAVLGELCRRKGIATVMVPHGTFNAVDDVDSEKDWLFNAEGMIHTGYDYLALQSPLVEKFVRKHPVTGRVVKTGPLLFGRPIRRSDSDMIHRRKFCPDDFRIILHAGTPKTRSATRFYNYETLEEYVAGIRTLIYAADEAGGLHVLVRYRVIDGLTPEDLRDLLPESNHFTVVSDGTFEDYLALADLLVSYSSTTIEEALQNEIPVLLWNPYDRYVHIPGHVLAPGLEMGGPSAVYHVNHPEHLSYALGWLKEKHLNAGPVPSALFDAYRYRSAERESLADVIMAGENSREKTGAMHI